MKQSILEGVLGVFESQQFILGAAVEGFEKTFETYLGAGHCVGMSSGTDAQLALLMALGIGPADAVITSPFTFFATAGCIHRTGAEPVFVDIEHDSFNLDPAKLEAFLAECPKSADGRPLTRSGRVIRMVVPIHLFGMCAKMDEITAIARRYGLVILEDAAQAVGAEYRGAGGVKKAGVIAETSYFSFFPTKNLGGAGDGGMSVCLDPDLAAKLRVVRNHGMEQRYFHREVGGNFRLDALQAVVLHAKLAHIDTWNAERRRNAALYADGFEANGLREFLTPPLAPDPSLPNSHIYHQYCIRAKHRDGLMKHLQENGIGCAIYYPVPLHLQECFAPLGGRQGDLPVSEQASREVLALPIFSELTEPEIAAVVDAIRRFYKS